MPPKKTIGRSSGGLPRYYLDVGWWRHRRFSGLDSSSLFVAQAAISYGNEHGSDGHMPADLEDLSIALGVRLSDLKKAAPKLESREIWIRSGEEFIVRDWSQHNPTRGEIEELSEERSTLGKLGNHEKWHVGRGITNPDCEFCGSPDDPFGDRPGDPVSDPEPIANGSQRNEGKGTDPPFVESAPDLSSTAYPFWRDSRVGEALEIIAKADTGRVRNIGSYDAVYAKCLGTATERDGSDLDRLAEIHADVAPYTLVTILRAEREENAA